MRNGRPFRWALQTVPRGDAFDLVPEETLETYRENPSDIGSSYRRISAYSAPGPGPDESAGTTKIPSPSGVTEARDKYGSGAPVETSPSGRSKPNRLPADHRLTTTNTPGMSRKESPPASAVTAALPRRTGTDTTVFVYRPAPTDLTDPRLPKDQGRAILSINGKGAVTAVKIVQSTGNRQFDADAVDTLRRWRAKPGPAQEVELPLTSVMSGKRIPKRVPTSAGSMTSG